MATSELFILSLILSVIFVLVGILDAITTRKALSHRDVREENLLMVGLIQRSPSGWFGIKILFHIAIASFAFVMSTILFLKAPEFILLILVAVLLTLDVVFAYVAVHNYVVAH